MPQARNTREVSDRVAEQCSYECAQTRDSACLGLLVRVQRCSSHSERMQMVSQSGHRVVIGVKCSVGVRCTVGVMCTVGVRCTTSQ